MRREENYVLLLPFHYFPLLSSFFCPFFLPFSPSPPLSSSFSSSFSFSFYSSVPVFFSFSLIFFPLRATISSPYYSTFILLFRNNLPSINWTTNRTKRREIEMIERKHSHAITEEFRFSPDRRRGSETLNSGTNCFLNHSCSICMFRRSEKREKERERGQLTEISGN